MASVSKTVNLTVKNAFDGPVYVQMTFASSSNGAATSAFEGRKYVGGGVDKKVIVADLSAADAAQPYSVEIYSSASADVPVMSKSFVFSETNAPSMSPGVLSTWSIIQMVLFFVIVAGILVLLVWLIMSRGSSASNLGTYTSNIYGNTGANMDL